MGDVHVTGDAMSDPQSAQSDLHKAFPPMPVRDRVPAICLALALLGLVLGGLVIAARVDPARTQVAIHAAEPAAAR